MAKTKSSGRVGCVEQSSKGYVLTAVGMGHIEAMSALGSSKTEIAEYLRVPTRTFTYWLDPESDLFRQEYYDLWMEGQSEFKHRLRQHQLTLSETNAQMAIHMGKQYLGQKDDAIEHNHVHHVVGTLPDYSKSAGDWMSEFAPKVVSDARRLEMEIEEADVVEVGSNQSVSETEVEG